MADINRARIAALRLQLDIAKAWESDKHPRFPKGDPQGGKFSPTGGTLGSWFANFFGHNDHVGSAHDLSDPNWGEHTGPQEPLYTIDRPGAVLHPKGDYLDRPVYIAKPSAPTPLAFKDWKSPDGIVTITPGAAVPKTLNGVPFSPWHPPSDWRTVEGQIPQLEDRLPPLDEVKGMHPAAGVIIQEPDGRIWLTKPTNGFGGYRHTFPKGTQEDGLTLQQTAIKEAWEETGLKVKVVGVLGDFKRTTSMARYYLAERVGGSPSEQGWESQALRLLPPDKVTSFLNMNVDRDIWRAYRDEEGIAKAKTSFVDRAALAQLQARIDSLVEKASGGMFTEDKHPRWPKGSPLAGQFMQTDAQGITLPPKVGSKANPAFANKVQAAYEAAGKGDLHKLTALHTSLTASAEKYGLDKGTAATSPGTAYNKAPHTQAGWAQGSHQYVTHLIEQQKSATLANLKQDMPKAGGDGVPSLTDYKKIEAKPGGSNPGAVYEGPDGNKYLVKGANHPSADRAKNEVLSAKLMNAAGVSAPDMHLVNLGKEHGGGLGVASKMEPLSKWTGSSALHKGLAQQDFAVHAWLANYDATGTPAGDNFALKGSKVFNYDPGGALLYRAQGLPKNLPGGMLPTNVSEWQSMRDKSINPAAHSVYGSMTQSQLAKSAEKLKAVDDTTITDLVSKYGPGTPEQKLKLAAVLVARRDDVLAKAGLSSEAPKVDLKVNKPSAATDSGMSIFGVKAPVVTHPDLQDTLNTIHEQALAGEPDAVASLGSGVYGLAGKAAEKDAVHDFAQNVATKMYGDTAPQPGAQGEVWSQHLTNTEPGHNKFWNINVAPKDGAYIVTKRWGKIGTQGQGMEVGKFWTLESAKTAAQVEAYTKLKGGYILQEQQSYAGSGYQKANDARHDAAQAPAPAAAPAPAINPKATKASLAHLKTLGDKADKAINELIPGGGWDGEALQAHMAIQHGIEHGDLASVAQAGAVLDTEKWASAAGNGSNAGNAHDALKAYAEVADKHIQTYGGAVPPTGKQADAGQIVESATGLKFNPDGNHVHYSALKAVNAFNAGDDKAMASEMGKIGMSEYPGSEHIYERLSTLAATKADQFPMATGNAAAINIAPDAAERPKPEAVTTSTPKVGSTVESASLKPAAPATPNFQDNHKGTAKGYYEGVATKMQDAYAKGDLQALKAAAYKPGKDGVFAWPVDASGNPKTMNAKLANAYHEKLVGMLGDHQAEATAANLAKPVGAVPDIGQNKGNLPAMPDFDRKMLSPTNTNAASHNAKVFQIKMLAQKGDVKGLLALGYGTNTYGKQQAALANDALKSLGSDYQVTAGQKKNSNFALTSTGNEQPVIATASGKPLSAALTDKELPPKIDFANYNGAGKGLSSKPAVNAANQQAFDKLVEHAKQGDIKGVKNATFQPIDPATGDPVGQPLPISQHPSQHIKNTQVTLLQTMDEKLHPPEPLKYFPGQQLQTVDQVSSHVPPKPFGTTSKQHPASQSIGYFLALGQVENPTSLAPQKTFNLTPESKGAAAADYQKMSSDAKTFVGTMQSSGGKKFANPGGGGGGFNAAQWEKITVAAHKDASQLPVGTQLYKWDNLTPEMKQKLSLVQPGLVVQNPAPVCTSYSPTSTKGFGSSHRFKIIVGPGAKVISSFGSGHYAGEGELSLLPNHRFMILSHKKNAGEGWAETTVLLLPPDPALEAKAKKLHH